MKLIVGLGNPGDQYKKSRHNFGFMAVDELRKVMKGTDWKLIKKYNALVSRASVENESVLFLKPQTYMNLSGEAVQSCASYYRVPSSEIWVIHDDKDLPLGKIRVRETGSSAGHKGIQSIIDHLGTQEFVRFRLGVSNPDLSRKSTDTADFVLGNFRSEEKGQVYEVIRKTTDMIQLALDKGVKEVMSLG